MCNLINTYIHTDYAKARGVSEVYLLKIEQKGLGRRFGERRRGRPAEDVFNIIQKRPNTVRCSPESSRSNGGS